MESKSDNQNQAGAPGVQNPMTFDAILAQMSEIHRRKNSDYGNSFELSAHLLNRPVVEGLLHRMSDKLARACRLAQGRAAQVQDEALTDTLLDLANYAVLAILAIDGEEDGHPHN
jgi:hypothetical protein